MSLGASTAFGSPRKSALVAQQLPNFSECLFVNVQLTDKFYIFKRIF